MSMMKKFRFGVAIVVVAMFSTVTSADYSNPPGWESNPYFTHQSWEFSTNQTPLAPDSTAHPVVNPNGTPSGEVFAPTPGSYTAAWIDDGSNFAPGLNRQGLWLFTATAQDGTYDALEFEIPNSESDDRFKQVWFEATMWTNNIRGEDPDEIYAKIFDDEGAEHPYTSRTLEFFGDDVNGAPFVHVTYLFDIVPQPAYERLVLGAHLLQGEMILLDQVDIDTRCIPEPSTAILFVMGIFGVGMFGRRRPRDS
jgi:hypothetical protein